jgi:hypothetical protein
VIDTKTGAVLPVRVPGAAGAILYRTDGTMLVRFGDAQPWGTLAIIAPDGTMPMQAREPSPLAAMIAIAYTR